MKVGVPTEIKADEYRVALTPAGVRELADAGHDVLVQAGAGLGSAIEDAGYEAQGATILPDADAVFGEADMIVKVKEPQPEEVARLEPRHVLFTYLHLAPAPELTKGLMGSGATCIAYETVEDREGRLPLLAPMSEVAGKIATQAGAFMLEKPLGGRGMLLGGVPGVAAGKVLVIGGGVVGTNAAIIALGMQAETYVFDRNPARLRELESELNWRASTVFASTLAIEEHLRAPTWSSAPSSSTGPRRPTWSPARSCRPMKRNAVLVDVSIDQGGCFETSRPTTHSDPTYEVDGVTHYCVANMPGAVPITSTYALTNATMPYVVQLASLGRAPSGEREPRAQARRQRGRRPGDLRPGGRGRGRAPHAGRRGTGRGRGLTKQPTARREALCHDRAMRLGRWRLHPFAIALAVIGVAGLLLAFLGPDDIDGPAGLFGAVALMLLVGDGFAGTPDDVPLGDVYTHVAPDPDRLRRRFRPRRRQRDLPPSSEERRRELFARERERYAARR